MTSKTQNVDLKKGAIRKSIQIQRNIEIPVTNVKDRRSVSVVKHPTVSEKIICPLPEVPRKYTHDYSVPKLNTAASLIKEIDKLKISSKPTKITSTEELTPRTKTAVTQEVTKRLNFPSDKQLFKGLVSINVNDSVLTIQECTRRPLRKKYKCRTNKDPIPELVDFLTPVEPLKYTVPLYDRPDVLRKPDNNTFKDIHDLYINYHPNF